MTKLKTTRANSARFSQVRRLALANVAPAAFASGVSVRLAADAVFSACGSKPVMALYRSTRDEFIAGRMASALPSNHDEKRRIADARDLLTHYQGHGGKAKLRKGMKGRRTKEQELAYGAARVAWTGVCKLAGVKVPDTRGGDTSKSRRAPQAPKGKAKVAANSNRPASPKCKDKGALIRYGMGQAVALLATVNKNAAISPPQFSSAVQAFHAEMKKLEASL